jgi:hypothetical protein
MRTSQKIHQQRGFGVPANKAAQTIAKRQTNNVA